MLNRKADSRFYNRLRFEKLEDRLAPAALLPGFTETAVASGLSNATAMELAPDGKLFVAEQAGTMEVWQSGARLQADFFGDTPLSSQSVGERGLLGVAFDPNYASNRFVYVYYTTTAADNHNRVSRFTANASGDLALAGSELVLLELDPHSATNHNGGAIHFGPDGKLYIAAGDDANQDNPTSTHNSQRLTTLHGKMLRINADGIIPGDNPFFSQTTGKYGAIWAMGLRNPFTFAFQPGSGRVFVNDVGASAWEEINDGAAGANYGWPQTEGDFDPASFPTFTRPLYNYNHNSSVTTPSGCAITGGVFYNPTTPQFGSDYVGDYFFTDLCGQWIYRIDTATKTVSQFATGIAAPVDLKVDAAGNLCYLARGSGQVFQVSFTAAAGPSTPGLYDPAQSVFYLRQSNSTGIADQAFGYGVPGAGWLPSVGDWDGDGQDTVGLYDPATSLFYLRNANSTGVADVTFGFGVPGAGWLPLAGDWNGDGVVTVGLYDPGTGTFFLKNSSSSGNADVTFGYGVPQPGWLPVVGDWDGNGSDTIGLYAPQTSLFFLRNANSSGFADLVVGFGPANAGWLPIAGDWDANHIDTVGLYNPSTSTVFQRNSNTTGNADTAFGFGPPAAGWLPLAGNWIGSPAPLLAMGGTNLAFAAALNVGQDSLLDPHAVDHIDLSTVAEHELDRLAGLNDPETSASALMSGALSLGTGRVPRDS